MGTPGRPKFEITDEVLQKVEALAAQGLSQEQIGSVLGISGDTIARRKKDNADFASAIKRGKQKGIATVTNSLFNKAKAGDNVSMIFFLKNRDPENWKDKRAHEVTGENGDPIQQEIKVTFIEPEE